MNFNAFYSNIRLFQEKKKKKKRVQKNYDLVYISIPIATNKKRGTTIVSKGFEINKFDDRFRRFRFYYIAISTYSKNKKTYKKRNDR